VRRVGSASALNTLSIAYYMQVFACMSSMDDYTINPTYTLVYTFGGMTLHLVDDYHWLILSSNHSNIGLNNPFGW
jgi:hypothetical protein